MANKNSDNKDDKTQRFFRESLEYHSKGRPGKIEVTPTKPCLTSRDLSMAYTPGVAHPCLEIERDPHLAYNYTAKGNLVGVISNGTAVLGLGNIGPMAGKPVMEGKGVLFKRFADIDVFDIEVDQSTVEGMVQVVKSIGPTFGGINLEDIKAPECFEIEKQLIEQLDIPVFHDDQHGTAIIASAGFINALEITKRKIGTTKIVFSGAGAAAMACAELFIELGAKRDNIIMCDSKGVIYQGRKDGMNKYKEKFMIETQARTLADAIKGADAFMGVSGPGVLSKEMVKTMADNPIIFAMANPTPEIYPDEVAEVRSDAIMATGRSDFPNQVNNVLGFPFIFRGALDVRAKKINIEMKLAAVKALADLAKEEVPDEVKRAYSNQDFIFGPQYLIPKPFDRRVLTRVAPAVAKAAVDSGVARLEIKDWPQYAQDLEERLGTSGHFMRILRQQLKGQPKKRIVFPEGSNTRVLRAVSIIFDEKRIIPILLGNKKTIHEKMEELHLHHLKELEIYNPDTDARREKFAEQLFNSQQRKGINRPYAQELLHIGNYFGSMMVESGDADGMITGACQSYPECVRPVLQINGTKKNIKAAGVIILVFNNRVLFLADCTMQIKPSASDLTQIALEAGRLFKHLLNREPRIAFLSFSSFGSNRHPDAKKVSEAVEMTRELAPDFVVDGEIQADLAVNHALLKQIFSFTALDKQTDILIFPDLSSANISYKLLYQLADARPIGPILIPLNKAINIVQRTSSASEIANMATLTAVLAKEFSS